MFDDFVRWRNELDASLGAMGPVLTIVLSMLFGGAVTQHLKRLWKALIKNDAIYTWVTRTTAIVFTFVFARFLSASLPEWMEYGVAFCQPLAYHVFMAAIRKWAPWAEAKSYWIGSVTPPQEAMDALESRNTAKENTPQA